MFIVNCAKDALEIGFFSLIVYIFSLWLKNDTRNNLLVYFYGYCAVVAFSSLLHLPIITAFLLYTSPLALILFIIFHQETLQRNFITLRKSEISLEHSGDWLEDLIRTNLYAINANKQMICIIEHQTSLKPFLETPFLCDSPVQQKMLIVLLESNGFDCNKMVWCTSHGKLMGINAQWNIHVDSTWQAQSVKELPEWQQDALLMTMKTDAIIFKSDPAKRSFDVVVKGIVHQDLSAAQTLAFIKKQLSHAPLLKGDLSHEQFTQKRTIEQ